MSECDEDESDLPDGGVDEAFAELLVNFVRQNACLYDKSERKHSDKHAIADTWQSISAACDVPVKTLMKQWKSLRNQFTREHRLQSQYEASGTGNDNLKRPRTEWYLYKSMLFLLPHISHRKSSGNFVKRSQASSSAASSASPSFPPLAAAPTHTLSSGSVWDTIILEPDNCDAAFGSLTSTPSTSAHPPSSSSQIRIIASEAMPAAPSRPSLPAPAKKLLVPPPDAFAKRKIKEAKKESDNLNKLIADASKNVSVCMERLEQRQAKQADLNEEDDAMVKSLMCALRRVNPKYKTKCFQECLAAIVPYQDLSISTADEVDQKMDNRYVS